MYRSFFTLLLIPCALACMRAQNGDHFKLADFYSDNARLSAETEAVFKSMSEQDRVAQMIITSLGKLGKPYEQVKPLIEAKKVGGVIFLSGDPHQFKKDIASINEMSKGWPLLMSMDAEPSLFNKRLPGTPALKPTAELKTPDEIKKAVTVIDSTLHAIGFHQNFAPVVDLSPNNEAIGNRTFGSDSATVVPKALAFIKHTQKDEIAATAKHFPGHGRVAGDTHKQLVYINGRLTEIGIYKPLIEAGVISVMVAHIAVENNNTYNTNGLPSTLSPVIVTNLLREKLDFKGIIITDAMNMGAVAAIPNSSLLAARAGCDMILMPPDETGTLESIMAEMRSDAAFRDQIHESVKRIIRLKLCLGMSFT